MLSCVTALAEERNGVACPFASSVSGQSLTLRGKVDRTMHDMLLVIPGCSEVAVLAFAGEADDALHGISMTSLNLPRASPVESCADLVLQRDGEFRRFEKVLGAQYRRTRRIY